MISLVLQSSSRFLLLLLVTTKNQTCCEVVESVPDASSSSDTNATLACSKIALSERECISSSEAVIEEAVPDLQKASNVTRSADTFALASHCLSAWPSNWQSLMTTSPNSEMICLALLLMLLRSTRFCTSL